MRIGMLAALMGVAITASTASQSEPLLQLQGQPYSAGSMTLHFIAPVGQPTLVLYGLDPLDPPLQTPKGPFHIGTVFNAVTLGAIPSLGRIDVPFVVPPLSPSLAGIPLVMQGYVPGMLTNPTTLPLDQPYYVPADATILVSPNPTPAGLFSDRVATGDLNGDGSVDVAVSAPWENAGGVSQSGRVYVFWGPTLTSSTTLEPPAPKVTGIFGQGLGIADFDGDATDDLVVTEGTGFPEVTPHGQVHFFQGGAAFSGIPSFSVDSGGTGTGYSQFGHFLVAADFDDDGYGDFAAGMPNAPVQGFTNAGVIEVFWGPGFAQPLTLVAPQVGTNGFFGERLGTGDLDGDGVPDLIVGNPRKSVGGQASMGQVHLFTGSTFTHMKTLPHPLPSGVNSRFGNDVVGTDLNGDGIAEVIATDQRNHAFVFWSPGFDTHLVITRPPDPVSGTAVSISFGYFATTGDVNGDGLADVTVGEPFAASQGRVYAALGPNFSDFLVLVDKVPENSAEFGWGVHVRDVDGDGRAELLAGSHLGGSSGRLTMFDFDG